MNGQNGDAVASVTTGGITSPGVPAPSCSCCHESNDKRDTKPMPQGIASVVSPPGGDSSSAVASRSPIIDRFLAHLLNMPRVAQDEFLDVLRGATDEDIGERMIAFSDRVGRRIVAELEALGSNPQDDSNKSVVISEAFAPGGALDRNPRGQPPEPLFRSSAFCKFRRKFFFLPGCIDNGCESMLGYVCVPFLGEVRDLIQWEGSPPGICFCARPDVAPLLVGVQLLGLATAFFGAYLIAGGLGPLLGYLAPLLPQLPRG